MGTERDESRIVRLNLTFDGAHPSPDRFQADPDHPDHPRSNSAAPTRPDADEVGRLIIQGNRRYAEFVAACSAALEGKRPSTRNHPLFLSDRELGLGVLHKTQSPSLAVMSCIDSRVPVELATGQAGNTMFRIRTAGNSLTPIGEARGSLEYILDAFSVGSPSGTKSVQAILVLGHTLCGAAGSVHQAVTEGRRSQSGAPRVSLAAIVNAMTPLVRSVVAAFPSDAPEVQRDIVSHANSIFTAIQVKQMAERQGASDGLKFYYATYNVLSPELFSTNLPTDRDRRGSEAVAEFLASEPSYDLDRLLVWNHEAASEGYGLQPLDDAIQAAVLAEAGAFGRACHDPRRGGSRLV